MCLDSLRLPSCTRNPHMPYSAAVDLVAGLGASQVLSEHLGSILVEGPEMAPVAPGIGLVTSLEGAPSEPTSDSEMTPEPESVAPAATRDMGIFVANSLPVAASPTPIPPTDYGTERGDLPGRFPILYSSPSTSIGNGEGRYARGGASEWDWPRQFIAQFFGTTRDSVDRARDELESRPGCSSSQCPQAE
ncbi:hypothetical protein M9H77_30644 [Catharanthus roseus]|uniref:Uncharacterized protein n=1 Tax=Catharanthus roseus TaxID=4058 RepID=A0ACB9ZXV9_CATRO|nr:hypothetical protein M9H77_30644 [Catharanthus roseus]